MQQNPLEFPVVNISAVLLTKINSVQSTDLSCKVHALLSSNGTANDRIFAICETSLAYDM